MSLMRSWPFLVLAFLCWGLTSGGGQVLNITGGVHHYSTIENSTVILEGRAELHVVAATDPISGSTITFMSDDAWLFLSNIRPSVVASSYVGQFRVDGQVAVPGENIRIVQYVAGSVIIPHASGFLPLQVFSGPHLQGASGTFDLLTYHRGADLGTLNDAISSFRLKRGYMVTLAENEDGTGHSKVYVAQDADLTVSVLPDGLDDAVSFVRVFPWRWTGKKGWAGGKENLVSPHWHYDWDNATSSSQDIEYVPMRHNLFWNDYANINDKQDSTHALGFNEPDRPDQANMTVAEAIAQWPNLLASGLRLGAPAPSDAGTALAWLYEFIAQADALDYRVDFVPVHFYKGGWNAAQYYNWLLDIHSQTGRPLWVTEFNNGANWTCCEPTSSSQAQIIGEFIEMLDNAPFVERYAIYNWVGANRELITGGSLTPAGIVYRDNASPLALTQNAPEGGPKGIARYAFENDTLDASGYGNNAVPPRPAGYAPGASGLAVELDGAGDFLRLPANLAHSVDFTFAAWVHWDGGGMWQRIFDFGHDETEYMFLTPRSAGETMRFAITTGGYGAEQRLETAPLPVGVWTHVAVTLSRSVGRLYVNGVPVDSSAGITIDPVDFLPHRNFLGRSQFAVDPLFDGRLDDVLVLDHALTGAQVAELLDNEAPQFSDAYFVGLPGEEGQPYMGTLAGAATDSGSSLIYSKAGGPSWLTVAGDGTLGGIPPAGSRGSNLFTVRATDSAGVGGFAVLEIEVTPSLPLLADPGFEKPVTSGFIYNPTGGTWTFSGSAGNGSGVAVNGSSFTGGNSPAPEGMQVAFLHAHGTVSQSVSGFKPSLHYLVSVRASQRQNVSGGQAGQTFDVRIDNTVIGRFEPLQSGIGYVDCEMIFTATSTVHTLTFAGTDLNGGRNMIFIDDVRISPTSQPPVTAPRMEWVLTPGDFQISWPVEHTGWHLQIKTNLNDANWQVLPEAAATNRLLYPTTGERAIFRLVRPGN